MPSEDQEPPMGPITEHMVWEAYVACSGDLLKMADHLNEQLRRAEEANAAAPEDPSGGTA